MKLQNKAYLFALGAVLFWSTVATAFKLALNGMTFAEMLLYSSCFSCIALFIIVLLQDKTKLLLTLGPGDYARSAILGLLNPFLYYLILFKAYSLIPAQEALTLNYSWAVMVVILSVPLLKQKINFLSFLAIIISFLGVIIIATHGKLNEISFSDPLGVSLAMSSSLVWALYWILNVKNNRDEIFQLFLNFLFGTIFILIYFITFHHFRLLSFHSIIASAYIGFFEMGITFYLWLKALKSSQKTAYVANLIFLSPFISLFIISLVLRENILSSTIIGLIFVIVGIVIQEISKNKRLKV